jgi:hypothetical protein
MGEIKTLSHITTKGFEDTFFNMLNFHTELVNNLEFRVENSDAVFKGRYCFNKAFKVFTSYYSDKDISNLSTKIKNSYSCFKKECRDKEYLLGHYFKSLTLLLDFIDKNASIENEFSRERRELYFNIVSSRLTSFEEKIIFYRVLANEDENFSKLIKENNILKPEWVEASEGEWGLFINTRD